MNRRCVIVTGAFGVLGTAVADEFEQDGYAVARVDFASAPPDLKGLAIGETDLTDITQAQRALDTVCSELDAPSVLVNIAGGFVWETLEDGGPRTWERMFRINALTAVTMCKVALPVMRNQSGAAIINIGANAAAQADAGMGAYAASKAAVARLTESLAAESADADLTVNAVLPTIIDTPTNRKDMPDADFSEWVQPRDIAKVVQFLASDAARCINGASIPVARGAR